MLIVINKALCYHPVLLEAFLPGHEDAVDKQRITGEIAIMEVWEEQTNTSYRRARVLVPASYQFIGYLDGLLVGNRISC